MFIHSEILITIHYRKSKMGNIHDYFRKKTRLVFQCDNCGNIFKRFKGAMDSKRVSNYYYHVCEQCDKKRFAQKKSVESKKIWDMPVSSLKTISRF